MATFRGFVIIGGLLTLALVWASFAWVLKEYNFATPLRLFLWSYVVSVTFLVTARMWDVEVRDKWCNDMVERMEGMEHGKQQYSDPFN